MYCCTNTNTPADSYTGSYSYASRDASRVTDASASHDTNANANPDTSHSSPDNNTVTSPSAPIAYADTHAAEG